MKIEPNHNPTITRITQIIRIIFNFSMKFALIVKQLVTYFIIKVNH